MRMLLLALTLVACAADDSTEIDRAAVPCAQLRDHLVNLRLATAAGTPDELAQHRAAMEHALGDGFVASCERNLNASQIACSLQAPDLISASACSVPSSSAR